MALKEEKKHQRTCIGCGKSSEKLSLFRIVRSPSGNVLLDSVGRKPGRGAYVCSIQCFLNAQKKRKLDRALRVDLSKDDYVRIEGELARFLETSINEVEE